MNRLLYLLFSVVILIGLLGTVHFALADTTAGDEDAAPSPTPTIPVYYVEVIPTMAVVHVAVPTPTPEPTAKPVSEPVSDYSYDESEYDEYAYESSYEPDPVVEQAPVVVVDDTDELVPLEMGYRGEAIKIMQQRLIDKGYLVDSADGKYGNKTKEAVRFFQFLNDLDPTGVADIATLELLYSDECPDGIDFPALNFREALEDPDSVEGQYLHMNGRVLQVILDSNVVMRVATRGAYEDVVYITCERTEMTEKLKEGDRLTIYGFACGNYTYKTASGKVVTLPYIRADLIAPR